MKNKLWWNVGFTSLTIDKGKLFASTTESQVFYNIPDEDTLIEASTGLEDIYNIFSLATCNGNLFAGTSSGILKRPVTEFSSAIKRSKEKYITSSMHVKTYSSSHHDAIIIEFRLPVAHQVLLKIHDVSGRAEPIMVNKQFTRGHHRLLLNSENIAKGCYILQIESGSLRNRKKLLIY